VLVLPGGGYNHHADHEGKPVAEWLNSLGVSAFVLKYRVGPDTHHPIPLRDARTAMRTIREGAAHWRIDPARVGVLGFSAGGHLAAHLASGPDTEPGERPDLAVLCYPVVSALSPPSSSADFLLGADATPAQRRAVSPERIAVPETPPVFLWHTADDPVVEVQHSLQFTQTLAELGVPVELHVFPHGRHGMGLAEEDPSVARWTTLCADWLRARGWHG
jgi:acetyl esterase/lipase